MLMNKLTEAIDDLTKAVHLNPNFPQAYAQKYWADYLYAISTINMHKMEELIKSLEKATQKFSKCHTLYCLYAKVNIGYLFLEVKQNTIL
jgi:hypothetical protein